jgi:hypothetical protein
VFGEGFDPGNRLVGNGKKRPLVARNASTGGKRKEIVVPGGVAGWGQGDGAERTGLGCVGRMVVFENLDVGTEFEF